MEVSVNDIHNNLHAIAQQGRIITEYLMLPDHAPNIVRSHVKTFLELLKKFKQCFINKSFISGPDAVHIGNDGGNKSVDYKDLISAISKEQYAIDTALDNEGITSLIAFDSTWLMGI
jgi:hypothetical protein